MSEEIIARAKAVAGIEGDDERLTLCCEAAISYVLAFCHLSVLPEKLAAITVSAALSGYETDCTVASIKEGDREITYAFGAFDDKLRPFADCGGRVPSEVVRDV